MKKSFLLITFLSLVAVFSFTTFTEAQVFTFTRNLSVGSSGQDVLMLQKLLNANLATEIASSGVGSPGNETAFFGNLTKNAVIKFQIQNNIQGTGFFGPITQAKIIQLLNVSNSSPINNQPTKTVVATSTANPVIVFSVSPYIVLPGGAVSIKGIDFTSQNNAVYLSGSLVGNFVSTSTQDIYFTAPSSLSAGTYIVKVTNQNGDSSTIQKPQSVLIIRNTSPSAPQATSFTPAIAGVNDTVTITGVNFSSTNNVLFSPFGSTTVSSADGTHIQFKPSSFAGLKTIISALTSTPVHSIDMPVYVQTNDGTTDLPVTIKVQF